MKTLKRMMVALLALLPLATGMAAADTERDYSRLFVFGASFLDPGNNFALTGETAHPPFGLVGPSYGIGGHHYSDGPTWVEVMAQQMGLTEWANPAYRNSNFGNYAIGHGRARELADDVLPSLRDQVALWKLTNCTCVEMNDTLFVMDSGYHDLLDIMEAMAETPPNLPEALGIMGGMAESIVDSIHELYNCGARHLLFANLFPAEYVPVANGGLPPDQISTMLTDAYNGRVQLELFLHPLPGDMNIYFFDVYTAVKDMAAMPENFGFTNVTDSCVTLGVVQDAFCKDRDGHFWWDPLHPSKKAQALLAAEALTVLPVND